MFYFVFVIIVNNLIIHFKKSDLIKPKPLYYANQKKYLKSLNDENDYSTKAQPGSRKASNKISPLEMNESAVEIISHKDKEDTTL